MDKLDTPATFLADLGKELERKEGSDAGVAKILAAHVLKASASDQAAQLAKDALMSLAAERAAATTKGKAHE